MNLSTEFPGPAATSSLPSFVEAEQGRVGDPSSRDGAPRRDTFAPSSSRFDGEMTSTICRARWVKKSSRRRRRVGEERRQERAPRDDAFVRSFDPSIAKVQASAASLESRHVSSPAFHVSSPAPLVDVRSQRTSEGVGAPVGVGRDQARGRREQLRRPGSPEGVERTPTAANAAASGLPAGAAAPPPSRSSDARRVAAAIAGTGA